MLIFNMTLLTSIQISFQSTNTNNVHGEEMEFVHKENTAKVFEFETSMSTSVL